MGRRKQDLKNIEVNQPEEVKPVIKFTYRDMEGNIVDIKNLEYDSVSGTVSIPERKPFFMDEVIENKKEMEKLLDAFASYHEWTPEEKFDMVVEHTLLKIQDLLIVKGKEYRRNNNPYHNFQSGSSMTGQVPEKVLHGFLLKHLVSYNDIINDIEKGVLPTEKMVEEKFNDILVYFLLQKAMILNRIDNESKA